MTRRRFGPLSLRPEAGTWRFGPDHMTGGFKIRLRSTARPSLAPYSPDVPNRQGSRGVGRPGEGKIGVG